MNGYVASYLAAGPQGSVNFSCRLCVSVTGLRSLLTALSSGLQMSPLPPLPWHQDSPSTVLFISVIVFLSF